MTEPMPSLFIPHGGGPCFFMEWTMGPRDTWDRMGAFLKGLAATLPRRPAAILVVSAHWEAPRFTILAPPRPTLLYDYYGFPEHTYRLRYDAPGAPSLGAKVRALLSAAGIATAEETGRGFDHGVFIPLMLVYPEADIPIAQLSLKAGLDAADHIAAGQALAPLRADDILIVGSGMSYHNMAAFMRGEDPSRSAVFDRWLTETVAQPDDRIRYDRLGRWDEAPAARDAHPREEHLLPLMVAAGAAAAPGRRIYAETMNGAELSGYRFG